MSDHSEPFLYLMLPTYNRPKLIKRTIESIVSQSYQHFFVTIFNDGSTEDYSEIKKLVQNYQNFEYIEHANIGVNAARNLMLENYKATRSLNNVYFCTISDDDFFTNDAFLIMGRVLKSNPDQIWFSFNCESLSQKKFINTKYTDYAYITYKKFRKDMYGDKHFVFKMSELTNIHYPQKFFKNGYEHLFYFKVPSKILIVPNVVKIIEYQNDGLSLSNLYDNSQTVKSVFKHILIDPFQLTYYFWMAKALIPLSIKRILKKWLMYHGK